MARNASRPDRDPVVDRPVGDERIDRVRGEPLRGGSTTIDKERLGRRPEEPRKTSRPPVDLERLRRSPDDAGYYTDRSRDVRTTSPSKPIDPNGYCGHGTTQEPYLSRKVVPPPTFSDDAPETRGSNTTGTAKADAQEFGPGTFDEPYIRRRT
jgi:hypothetical protein